MKSYIVLDLRLNCAVSAPDNKNGTNGGVNTGTPVGRLRGNERFVGKVGSQDRGQPSQDGCKAK
jgi:hypothetical protein